MTSYSYRRELTREEMVPALAAGAGLGLAVAVATAYLTQMFLRRTPLRTVQPERAGPAAAPLDAVRPQRRGRVAT